MHTTSHSLSINLEATACDHVAAKSENTYVHELRVHAIIQGHTV